MSDEKEIGISGLINTEFFTSGKAVESVANTVANDPTTQKSSKKKTQKIKVDMNGIVTPEIEPDNKPSVPGAAVVESDYAASYSETNRLLREAIFQTDVLSAEIKKDIDDIRSSRTLKGKYTYLTNLTGSASALISTKISAIKELNSVITQGHNLELNRFKTLKPDKNEDNDDMKMMNLYSAFVNTPIGTYTPQMPSMQDITLGVNSAVPPVSAIEMTAPNNIVQAKPLTPEQNRMRMEANPNIQTVVRFDQSTGNRYFDVVDRTTGASVPNYPRPDAFLLEDTTIDTAAGIARNRNINEVWPLIVDGPGIFSEY